MFRPPETSFMFGLEASLVVADTTVWLTTKLQLKFSRVVDAVEEGWA
jgi:hypothetical protein